MEQLTLARQAMATRFEFVLAGSDATRLRAAGEEALDEIQRIEGQLSLHRAGSEIAEVNKRAALEAVRVSPEVFNLLIRAREFHEISGGSFDPTIAPLVRCWGFMKGSGTRPTDEEIAAAAKSVGFPAVELDSDNFTVRFSRPGMMLDLGSIGKGYALDCAVEIIRDAGVADALLHGGTSTIVAMGNEPGRTGWKVAIEDPQSDPLRKRVIAVVELIDQSLSVSAIWGKFFQIEGKTYGHVLDPRTGWPALEALMGAVILDTAIATDALSTAVLLGSDADLAALVQRVPVIRYLQMKTGAAILTHGIELDKSLDISAPPSV